MGDEVIYLDNNATTRPTAGVAAAVTGALTEFWHNPSSVHRAGQAARRQVELARAALAELIGARARDLVLTGSGTEAIDLAIRGRVGAWEAGRGKGAPGAQQKISPGLADSATPSGSPEGDEGRLGRERALKVPDAGGTPAPQRAEAPQRAGAAVPVIVTTKIEHAAVRDLVEDLEKSGRAEVRWAALGEGGVVNVARLAGLLDERVAVVSVQWANNETGVVQPVREIAALCRARNVVFHCDATQWVGKMGAKVEGDEALDASLLTFSPHKFHGPKGVGVLWARRGVGLRPVIHGAQELGRRGGTENVPGIIGAGVAAREALEWLRNPAERERLGRLRDRFEAGVLERIADAVVNGPADRSAVGGRRLWNTTNIGFPRLEAEALLLLLSERGLCASAGAACSSGSLDPSPVLLAMGIPPEIAHGSLRFSLSRETTEEEIDRAVGIVAAAVERLRASLV